jgi:hypothetical protein
MSIALLARLNIGVLEKQREDIHFFFATMNDDAE